MKLKNNLSNQACITHTTDGATTCIISNEPFSYVLNVAYVPDEWLLELIAFDEFVRDRGAEEATTIEELCDKLFNDIVNAIDPLFADVVLSATTKVHGATSIRMVHDATNTSVQYLVGG